MAHFPECLRLDLPNAFARDAELPADFLKRPRIAVTHAETQLQHAPFALAQARENMAQLVLEQA